MPAKKSADPSQMEVTTNGNKMTVLVHKALYPTDVLFGAAFTFLDRCFIHLDMADGDRIRVELEARPESRFSLEALLGDFKNELVSQSVRRDLARKTEKVRAMIVGRAIVEAVPSERAPAPRPSAVQNLPPEVAKLLAEEEDSLDFLDDPLGIAVPWEEKYGKKGAEGSRDKPAEEK
jgi:His-Xaa-Ser system protein HxsD